MHSPKHRSMSNRWYNNIGPATLIAAAFIGPGTVTVCSLAGATHGYTLLWALTLSIIATIVLQEMSARLGIITQKGLGESIRSEISQPIAKAIAIVLVLAAIILGNAAYEAGNISGAVLGSSIWEGMDTTNIKRITTFFIGLTAFLFLWLGNYKWLEKILITLVLIMSVSFVIAALLSKPDIVSLMEGAFIPSMPDDSILTVIGLVGTTVVPYNLFLHAALVKEKWSGEESLGAVRKDLYISIILGGLVSMCIIIVATNTQGEITNAVTMAQGLEMSIGSSAKYLIGTGLLAAGITSAITAPLAAAYAAKGILGWDIGMKDIKFRAIWISILLIGIVFSILGYKPITIIKIAQVSNGILLPIIATYLLWIVNRKNLMGQYVNSFWQNILGFIIILVTIILASKTLWSVFG